MYVTTRFSVRPGVLPTEIRTYIRYETFPSDRFRCVSQRFPFYFFGVWMMTTCNLKSSTALASLAGSVLLVSVSVLITKLWSSSSDTFKKSNTTGSKDRREDDASRMIPDVFQQSSCPYRDEVRLGVELAIQAGKNMLDHYDSVGTDRKSTLSVVLNKGDKSGIDFATDVDTRNEKLVMKGIKSAFPDHEIIGEESCSVDGSIPTLTKTPTWIVDPVGKLKTIKIFFLLFLV